MLQFQAQDKPIKEILFSHDQFRIPEYQRPYSRGIDEASDFRDDLMQSSNGYFLGSFVFNYENQKKTQRVDIIDGQQRSLTITIFIASIRDSFRDIGYTDIAQNIQRDFISKPNYLGTQMDYRIIPGESCKSFFNKYIQDNNGITYENIKKFIENQEQKKIMDVYNFFNTKIIDDIKDFTNEEKKGYLANLIEKICDLRAIRIKIENEIDAYTIFETVNARGIDLSVSDLVKNLIFKHYDEKYGKLDNAKILRNEIEQNIAESGQEISKFLRHYWISKYKYITEKDLFKEIKNNIKDYESFLQEIARHSYRYKIIINPKDYSREDLQLEIVEGKEKVPMHIYNSLLGISIIKIRQYSTVLLSIFRNFDMLIKIANPRNLIENMEKFGYIYYGICSLPAKQVEIAGSTFAIQLEKECHSKSNHEAVSNSIQSQYNKYKEFMKKNLPTYDEFKNSFGDLSYRKKELTKYTLVKVSNYIEHSNTQDDLFDYQKINIEHILPKEPKERGLNKKEVEKYIDKIGNLTLLGKRMNSKVGNLTLKDKTENEFGFKASPITMTKKLVENFRENSYVWREIEISQRHEELGRIIYDIQKII